MTSFMKINVPTKPCKFTDKFLLDLDLKILESLPPTVEMRQVANFEDSDFSKDFVRQTYDNPTIKNLGGVSDNVEQGTNLLNKVKKYK